MDGIIFKFWKVEKNNSITSIMLITKYYKMEKKTGGWEKCWEEEITPWDLGRATPLILHLVDSSSLPLGRALVPGCGGVSLLLLSSLFFGFGLDYSFQSLISLENIFANKIKMKSSFNWYMVMLFTRKNLLI